MSSEIGRRAVAVDALLGFAVFAVVAIAVGSDVSDPGVDDPLVVELPKLGYLIAALLGVLMFWRRTRPVVVLLATGVLIVANYVLDLPIIGLAVPLAPALYSAAEAVRTRWALGTAAGLLLLSTGVRLLQGQDPAFVLGYELASTIAIMVAAIALGHIQVQRGRAEEQRRRIVELDRQAARAEAAERVSLERTRIARDLHDAVGHRLTAVMLHSSVAVEALTNTLKHARARTATVEFTRDEDGLAVTVADNGATPAGLARPGSGLAGLRERVRLVGGKLEHGPRDEGGYLVRARPAFGGPR